MSIRLSLADREALTKVAVINGSPSLRAFCREVLSLLATGDAEKMIAFNSRLIEQAGQQMIFAMKAQLRAPLAAQAKAKEGGKRRRAGKEGRKRGRRT